MKKLLDYLKEYYDISCHIDVNEQVYRITLYIEQPEFVADICIEYNAKEDWSVTRDDGHGGFDIGYQLTNGAITVHSISYYEEHEQLPVSLEDRNKIETELNRQLKQATT